MASIQIHKKICEHILEALVFKLFQNYPLVNIFQSTHELTSSMCVSVVVRLLMK